MDMCHTNDTSRNNEPKSCVEDSGKDSKLPSDQFKTRSLSPSSPSLSTSEITDECDSTIQEEYKTTQLPPSPTKSIILPSYERKKSQSVKLVRINLVDSSPKKAVRFADDFGLVLNQIKLITTDELPRVHDETFNDLQIQNIENSLTSSHLRRTRVINSMEPKFENPIHTFNFNDRVSQQKIVLEQANAIDNRIYGTIKLFSFALHKRVKIRLTTDNWISSRDYNLTYIPNSYDGTYDRFSFIIEIERHRICAGNNIQFCLCYEAFGGSEYWDNNYQENYRFDCVTRTIPDFSL